MNSCSIDIFKKKRDDIVNWIHNETEDIGLAVLAAGVPASEINITNLPHNIANSHVGYQMTIGKINIPICVEIKY